MVLLDYDQAITPASDVLKVEHQQAYFSIADTFVLTGCSAAGSTTINVTYQSQGQPVAVGQTGQRAFCSDQSGVIKYDATGVGATCTSTGSALQ